MPPRPFCDHDQHECQKLIEIGTYVLISQFIWWTIVGKFRKLSPWATTLWTFNENRGQLDQSLEDMFHWVRGEEVEGVDREVRGEEPQPRIGWKMHWVLVQLWDNHTEFAVYKNSESAPSTWRALWAISLILSAALSLRALRDFFINDAGMFNDEHAFVIAHLVRLIIHGLQVYLAMDRIWWTAHYIVDQFTFYAFIGSVLSALSILRQLRHSPWQQAISQMFCLRGQRGPGGGRVGDIPLDHPPSSIGHGLANSREA